MYLLGTIFRGGLTHILCLNEYLWQQEGVCGIYLKLSTVAMFSNEEPCHTD